MSYSLNAANTILLFLNFLKSGLIMTFLAKIFSTKNCLTSQNLKKKITDISHYCLPVPFVLLRFIFINRETNQSGLKRQPPSLTTIAIVLQNHKGRYKEILNIPEFISDNHIFIKEGSQLKRVKTKDIFYIMSDANYLHINTAQKNYLVRNKLLDFYTELPDKEFIQVHRRFLINKHHVDSFDNKLLWLIIKLFQSQKALEMLF
jgi:hypothetical protein